MNASTFEVVVKHLAQTEGFNYSDPVDQCDLRKFLEPIYLDYEADNGGNGYFSLTSVSSSCIHFSYSSRGTIYQIISFTTIIIPICAHSSPIFFFECVLN